MTPVSRSLPARLCRIQSLVEVALPLCKHDIATTPCARRSAWSINVSAYGQIGEHKEIVYAGCLEPRPRRVSLPETAALDQSVSLKG